ncbi:hypothetical protein [Aquimarina sp. MMG016]|uniref:hypothetical protein n=1 Tax=Aquimarina sp. MMG016 TaxID=2822690 RepID=UPI001B3A1FEA|nr:hypothetical protein [Aquimarina sp. MMG016]MBQ4818614.1 hypothetical protein [Aquimarina sp. MMG016]
MRITLITLFIISTNVYCQQNKSEILESKSGSENQSLDKISENTVLTLTAYFPDLGEFGGHEEEILIKRKKNEVLEATILEYNRICNSCEKVEELKVVKNEILSIDKKGEKAILNYLNKIFLESMKNNHLPSHAMNRYFAKMESHLKLPELDYKYTCFTINFEDTNEWGEFKKLKELLKK